MRKAILSLMLLIAATGCQSYYRTNYGAGEIIDPETLKKISVKTVRIELFTCDDQIIAEAVRNVFIGELAREGLDVVRTGAVDIVVTGTITISRDSSSRADSSGFGFGATAGVGGKASSASGNYVSGISCIAEFKEQIVGDGSYTQRMSTGGNYDAPEEMAKRAAKDLIYRLYSSKQNRKIMY